MIEQGKKNNEGSEKRERERKTKRDENVCLKYLLFKLKFY
jgi:hypothetical protein